MSLPFLAVGLGSPDLADAFCRLGVGSFFVISGCHKIFHPVRRAQLRDTFKADGVYHPAMMVIVPWGEFLGGLGVVVGCLTVPAAFGLIVLCLGACCFDGVKRIPAMKPLTRADYIGCVLYLPEVLYVAILAVLICQGAGKWSLDAYLFR